jgi:hypothetical protein
MSGKPVVGRSDPFGARAPRSDDDLDRICVGLDPLDEPLAGPRIDEAITLAVERPPAHRLERLLPGVRIESVRAHREPIHEVSAQPRRSEDVVSVVRWKGAEVSQVIKRSCELDDVLVGRLVGIRWVAKRPRDDRRPGSLEVLELLDEDLDGARVEHVVDVRDVDPQSRGHEHKPRADGLSDRAVAEPRKAPVERDQLVVTSKRVVPKDVDQKALDLQAAELDRLWRLAPIEILLEHVGELKTCASGKVERVTSLVDTKPANPLGEPARGILAQPIRRCTDQKDDLHCAVRSRASA